MTRRALPEELTLLAHHNTSGKRDMGVSLDLGLAGAVLLELALEGRVDVRDDRVVVLDPTPTGNDPVDAGLARIAADAKQRKPQAWVEKLQKGLRGEVLDGLVRDGVLDQHETKILGLFPSKRFPVVDDGPEREVRARLDDAVLRGVTPERRTAALVSLVKASGLRKACFPDGDRKAVDRRMVEIAEGEWAGVAVRKAVDAVTAAMMVAVTVATSGAAAASSS